MIQSFIFHILDLVGIFQPVFKHEFNSRLTFIPLGDLYFTSFFDSENSHNFYWLALPLLTGYWETKSNLKCNHSNYLVYCLYLHAFSNVLFVVFSSLVITFNIYFLIICTSEFLMSYHCWTHKSLVLPYLEIAIWSCPQEK